MKKIVLAIAILGMNFTFAQKKEIQNAVKAIENNDTATTNTEIAKAEGILGNNNLHLLEPSVLEQYYYAKGLSLIRAGKTLEGASYLGKISDMKTIYSGRDAQKNKVYFVGKIAANKSGISGLKAENYSPKTTAKVVEIVNPLLKTVGDDAYKAYQAKDYNNAAEKYLETYNLLKAIGNDNQLYLYYAALNYNLGGKRAEAVNIYNQLIDSGYTGVTTQYLATNIKTGEVQSFDKNSYEFIQKTGSKEYKDLKTEQTPSVELELYENTAGLLIELERYEEALALIEKGVKKFPQSTRLPQLQGTAFYKSGKTEEFIGNLQKQLATNPNDKESWYNLGYLQSQNDATLAEAENSFKKALEADPNYTLAMQGLIYSVYLRDDDKAVEKIRELQKSKKISEMNKIMDARKERFKKALPYLEKWYTLEPNSTEAVSTLKGVYLTLDREDKYNEFKKKEESLKK